MLFIGLWVLFRRCRHTARSEVGDLKSHRHAAFKLVSCILFNFQVPQLIDHMRSQLGVYVAHQDTIKHYWQVIGRVDQVEVGLLGMHAERCKQILESRYFGSHFNLF